MKNVIVTALLSFGLSCSQYTYAPSFNANPLAEPTIMADSTSELLNLSIEKWNTSEHGYHLKETGSLSNFSNHAFFLLQDTVSTYYRFRYDDSYKEYVILNATFPKETWYIVDSLIAEFWQMPEISANKQFVLDGGESELIGINGNVRHRVLRRNASTQDTLFYKISEVFWNDLFILGTKVPD